STLRLKFVFPLILLTTLLIGLNAVAHEETSTVEPTMVTATSETPSPTLPPTEVPETVVVTETATSEAPSTPAAEVTEATAPEVTDPAPEATEAAEVTSEPTQPSETPTETPLTETPVSETPTATVTEPPMAVPLAMQDFCQMDIGDRGDTNAFTYSFAAI